MSFLAAREYEQPPHQQAATGTLGHCLTVLDSGPANALPAPDVLMTRGGLLVNAATPHAAERLCAGR